MTAPFDDDDMVRWAALDLDDRAKHELMLDEMHVAGIDAALADWSPELLHSVIAAFTAHHDQSPTAGLVCQALLVVWHRVHPDVSWMIHSSQALNEGRQ